MVMAGFLMPGLAGTASAQDASWCEAAEGQPAGTPINGYTVVYGSGGSGSQIVLSDGSGYLSGGSGNDVLCAWGGNNVLDGGSGNDVLIVMSGTGNTLLGGSGNDTLIGMVGDHFDGGSGANSQGYSQTLTVGVTPRQTMSDTFSIEGSGFSGDSSVYIEVSQLFSDTDPPITDYNSGTLFTDSEGQFNTWIDDGNYVVFGCTDTVRTLISVTIVATDNKTGGSVEKTFTYNEACVA